MLSREQLEAEERAIMDILPSENGITFAAIWTGLEMPRHRVRATLIRLHRRGYVRKRLAEFIRLDEDRTRYKATVYMRTQPMLLSIDKGKVFK